MPMPETIRADGVDWPLDTFIDSYRMIVIDGKPPNFLNHDPSVDVLMENGSFVTKQPASLVEWHRVHAFACEALSCGKRCDICGGEADFDELLPNNGRCEYCSQAIMADQAR